MMLLTWTAKYLSGQIVYQIDPVTGEEKSTGDLTRSGLRSFFLQDHLGFKFFTLNFQPGNYFLFRRRVRKTLGLPDEIFYVLGIAFSFNPFLGCLNLIHPSGTTEVFSDFLSDSVLLYPFEFIVQDKTPIS